MFKTNFVALSASTDTDKLDKGLQKQIKNILIMNSAEISWDKRKLYITSGTRAFDIPYGNIKDWKPTDNSLLVITPAYCVQINRPPVNAWTYYRAHKGVTWKDALQIMVGAKDVSDQATPLIVYLDTHCMSESNLSARQFHDKMHTLSGKII